MRPFLLLISVVLVANGSTFSWADDPCTEAQTQLELTECYGKQYEVADQKLNQAYNALLRKLSQEHKAKVEKAQMTWIEFRDQQCEAETHLSVGGSIHPMELAICKTALAQTRTDQLNSMLRELEN